MTVAVGQEVEAKLAASDAAALERIARCGGVDGWCWRPTGRHALHSIYLDTSGLVLARAGIAVRLRRDGRHWQATLKWRGEIRDGVHARPELNLDLAAKRDADVGVLARALVRDERAAAYLEPWLCGRRLAPLFVTDIVRRTFAVCRCEPADSPEVAELALDQVAILRQPGVEPVVRYDEVEVERLAGAEVDVGAMAACFVSEFGLEPADETKFSRALALLHPKARFGGSSDRKADPGAPAAMLLRRIVAEQLERLRRAEVETRLRQDPEALHDLRVAARRLRSAFKAFRGIVASNAIDPLADELKWFANELSTLREVDVEMQRLDELCEQAPLSVRDGIASLRARQRTSREAARQRALKALGSRRYRRLLLALERLSLRLPPGEITLAAMAAKAVRQAFKRVRKRAEATPSAPADMHELRIRTKRLRYVIEFFSSLVGKPARRVLKDLAALQDVLGTYHDAVVAADRIQAYAATLASTAAAPELLSLGMVLGAEMQVAGEMQRRFTKRWRRFCRGKRRRHLRAVLVELDRLA